MLFNHQPQPQLLPASQPEVATEEINLQPLHKDSDMPTNTYNVPAGETCPESCIFGDGTCYGLHGCAQFSNVKPVHAENRRITKRPGFIRAMARKIQQMIKSVMRVNSIGEFETILIMQAWFVIASLCPKKTFYAYTKRISWYKRLKSAGLVPKNFTIICSYGSDEDYLIDESVDRNVRYYSSAEEIEAAGRVNVSKDDSLAFKSDNLCLGIEYH